MKAVVGVYKIVNLNNKKTYVGSSKSVYGRWITHKRELAKGTHHNYKIQRDYNKWGLEYFRFSVLEECVESELLKVEQKHIDVVYNKKKSRLYNITNSAKYSKPSEQKKRRVKIKSTDDFELSFIEPPVYSRVSKKEAEEILGIKRNEAVRKRGITPKDYELLGVKYPEARVGNKKNKAKKGTMSNAQITKELRRLKKEKVKAKKEKSRKEWEHVLYPNGRKVK
jgi:group I intron endonuclease